MNLGRVMTRNIELAALGMSPKEEGERFHPKASCYDDCIGSGLWEQLYWHAVINRHDGSVV
jgi:hypothetical protein